MLHIRVCSVAMMCRVHYLSVINAGICVHYTHTHTPTYVYYIVEKPELVGRMTRSAYMRVFMGGKCVPRVSGGARYAMNRRRTHNNNIRPSVRQRYNSIYARPPFIALHMARTCAANAHNV